MSITYLSFYMLPWFRKIYVLKEKNCLKKIYFYIFNAIINDELYTLKNIIVSVKILLLKNYKELLTTTNITISN